jgi:hypothetical protein
MFANAWLAHKGENPGKYPSGGPVSRMHEVWRYCAPATGDAKHIDILESEEGCFEDGQWKRGSRVQNSVFRLSELISILRGRHAVMALKYFPEVILRRVARLLTDRGDREIASAEQNGGTLHFLILDIFAK